MTRLFTIALTVVVFLTARAPLPAQVATEAPAGASIEQAAWLAGCWRMDGRHQMEEQWMAPAGGVMLGMNRSLRDGEFRGYELLILKPDGGRLVYEAHPSGQAAAEFASSHVSDTLLVFENPAHDFPQKLVYRRTVPDSVYVEVFGAVTDESPAFTVSLARIECPGPAKSAD